MSEEQTDKRSASERIQDLEQGMVGNYQTMDTMTRDIMVIKEAIKLLGNKVDSIVKASERGQPLTDDVLSKIMIENNVEELRGKVTNLVSQGILAPQQTVDDNSFLVGREINDMGEVVNPRLQFALQALQEDMRAKIKGSRPGDIISLQEGKLKFEVMETYSVQPPKAPEVDSGAVMDAAPVESNG
jgi:hypothetical protein